MNRPEVWYGRCVVVRLRTGAEPRDDPEDHGYETTLGRMIQGMAEHELPKLRQSGHQVQLVFTSPPFPLNTKKRYGNMQGEAYVAWLAGFASRLKDLLTPTGSIVMELGNAWEPGRPVMSTLALRALLAFVDSGNLQLCQTLVCHNPARLPSPAQWVTVDRIRLKDSYTNVWWMSANDRPKADNRLVLTEYGPRMKKILAEQTYNAGRRPSEHHISSTSFLTDNGGAIPGNVLSFSNTSSNDQYLRYCRLHGLRPHPARMPPGLVEFFVKFLTDPGDLVLDPFAGSNTTGAVAEGLGRRWLSIEPDSGYAIGSVGRFNAVKSTEDQPA